MNKKSFVIKSSEPKEFPISCDYSYKEENPKIVIFCHGFKGFKDWGCWNLVANYFVNNGLNFLKFNFSQNGTTLDNVNQISDFKSFRNNNYSIELQDLIRVINHIKSPKSLVKCNDLYLIGHSRGGGIACLATQYHPEIAKLVTWASVADFKERFPAKNELLKWKKEEIRYIINSRTGEKYPQDYQFYEDFIKNENSLNISKALMKYNGELLVCYGIFDQVIPKRDAFNMVNFSKNAEIISFRTNHTFGSKHPWDNTTLPLSLRELCDITINFLKN